MIVYKKEKIETEIMEKFICDRCKKEILADDDFELQETLGIEFIGGYTSVFGDGNSITCDLCQQCLKELIGDFCKYNGEGVGEIFTIDTDKKISPNFVKDYKHALEIKTS